jgi:hypothetical protein
VAAEAGSEDRGVLDPHHRPPGGGRVTVLTGAGSRDMGA